MTRPCHIPLGARGLYEAIVDADDYAYLTQWRWNFKRSRGGKIYARRTDRSGGGMRTLLIHDVVLIERMGKPRPSPKHTADHDNRKSLDNTRDNLDWATASQQARNRRRWKVREPVPVEAEIPF